MAICSFKVGLQQAKKLRKKEVVGGGGGEEKEVAQHTVVRLMTSNCSTWEEPSKSDKRAKHAVASVDIF